MAQATLTWNASPSTYVTGYRIHHSTIPGGPYNDIVSGSGFPITLGNVLMCTITGLAYETNYYLVVTALTATGAESVPSNEVNIFIPNPIPAPPSGVVVTAIS